MRRAQGARIRAALPLVACALLLAASASAELQFPELTGRVVDASGSLSGAAEQRTLVKGAAARGDASCTARATCVLPAPLSPTRSTDTSRSATRSSCRTSLFISFE